MVKAGEVTPVEAGTVSSYPTQPPRSPDWSLSLASRPKMKRSGTPFPEKVRRELKRAGLETDSGVSRVKKKMVFKMAEELLAGKFNSGDGAGAGVSSPAGVQQAGEGNSQHMEDDESWSNCGCLGTCTCDLSTRNGANLLLHVQEIATPILANCSTSPMAACTAGSIESHGVDGILVSHACDVQKEKESKSFFVVHACATSFPEKDNSNASGVANLFLPPSNNVRDQPAPVGGATSEMKADVHSPALRPPPATDRRQTDDPLPKVQTHEKPFEGAAGTNVEGEAERVGEGVRNNESNPMGLPVNLHSGVDKGIGTAGLNEGVPSLSFSNDETKVLADKIGYAIIGKFSHSIPAPHQIQKTLSNIQFENGFKWKSMNAKHILIQFRDVSDYARMLNGPNGAPVWYVDNHPMRVFKWTPDFDTYFESPIAAVWCKLIGIPIHLYEQSALLAIGKLLGKPIQADHATINQTRLTFARICVEIDISNPPPEEIILNILGKDTRYKVVWDRIPAYCMECKHVGHVQEECLTSRKKKPPTKDHKHGTKPSRAYSRHTHTQREWRPKGSKVDDPTLQPDLTTASKEEPERGPPKENKDITTSTSVKVTRATQVQIDEDGFQLVTRRKKGKMNIPLHHPQEGPHKAPYIEKLLMGGNVATISFGKPDVGRIDPGGSSMVIIS